jgi:cell division protein FtsQ
LIGAEATNRFHRPVDLRATRRNHRQLQARRILIIAANVALALTIAVAATWVYRRTQSSTRFSVQKVEAAGAVHTASAAVTAITAKYVGTNLFRLDIEQLRGELTSLPWVERVAIEKRIPDTLAIRVFERTPVALLSDGTQVRYVDQHGKGFAPLSVSAGNPELPLVANASAADLPRTVAFLERLRSSEPALYSRVSEIQPLAPDAYVVFDRGLSTYVRVAGDESVAKWKTLYAIAQSEQAGGFEYADLRFTDRIIVKPRQMKIKKIAPAGVSVSTGITN